MKKISFYDKFHLTQAVLDGRKTMVRFVVPQRYVEKAKAYQQEYYEGALERISIEDALLNMAGAEKMISSPYKVGEVVAVVQSYKTLAKEIEQYGCLNVKPEFMKMRGWSNKMFVKAEYMPHHVRIVSMKVERLQKISEKDAMREGVIRVNETSRVLGCKPYYTFKGSKAHSVSAKVAFIGLMYRHKKREKQPYPREVPAVAYNPYLWAYEIELVD